MGNRLTIARLLATPLARMISGVHFRDMAMVFVPKVLNGGAVVLLNLLVIRRLAPAEYGVFSICATGLILFDALLGSALDLSVLREISGKHRPAPGLSPIERAAVQVKLVLAVLMILLALIGGEFAGKVMFHTSGGRPLLTMLALGGSALLLFRSVQVYFQAQLDFKRYGATDLIQTALRFSLVLLLLRIGSPTAVTLIACYAAAPVLAMLFFSGALFRKGDTGPWFPAGPRRRLVSFAATVFATIGVSALAGRLDLFLVGIAGSSYQAGLYGAAFTIALIPELIGSYLAPGFTPKLVRYQREGGLYNFYRKVQGAMWIVAGAGLLISMVSLHYMLPLFFPPRYAASLRIITLLLPGTFAGLAIFPVTVNLLMFCCPRVVLIYDCITAPLLVALYVGAVRSEGVVGVAVVSLVSRLVKVLFLQVVAFRVARRSRQAMPESAGIASHSVLTVSEA